MIDYTALTFDAGTAIGAALALLLILAILAPFIHRNH